MVLGPTTAIPMTHGYLCGTRPQSRVPDHGTASVLLSLPLGLITASPTPEVWGLFVFLLPFIATVTVMMTTASLEGAAQ